jgi:hypothetical protein
MSYAYWSIDGAKYVVAKDEFEVEDFGLLDENYHVVDKPKLVADLKSVSDFKSKPY